MRAGEPGRGEVGAVENPAFGNHSVVELGTVMVGQGDGGAGEEGEEVLEEMELQKTVEEGEEDEGDEEQVVPDWNERERLEEETVGVGGGRTPPIQIHGNFGSGRAARGISIRNHASSSHRPPFTIFSVNGKQESPLRLIKQNLIFRLSNKRCTGLEYITVKMINV